MKPTHLNFTSGVLLTSVPDVFFLVEEQSDGASEAGQVSQPVQACEPGLGDLPKPTTPAPFLGVKLMFVVIMNFSNVKKRFVVVKICWSNSSQFSVILIWSSELASYNGKRPAKKIDIFFLFYKHVNN